MTDTKMCICNHKQYDSHERGNALICISIQMKRSVSNQDVYDFCEK